MSAVGEGVCVETLELSIEGISIRCDLSRGPRGPRPRGPGDREGQRSARGARPLVLVHGFTGHREDFLEVLRSAPELGPMVAPDLRGHGDATRPADPASYTLDQLVEDLRATLDALEIERCDLLGHSFGGMVVLRFVLRYPMRVASLILVGTAADCPESIVPGYLEATGELAREHGMAALQEKVERSARRREAEGRGDPHVALWADRYWPHHRKRYCAMDPEAYARLGRAMCEQVPVVDRLSEIRCRTLVLVGDGDETFLPGSEILAARIPDTTRVVIAGAGHHPHQEQPRAWRAAMRAHLEAARAAASAAG